MLLRRNDGGEFIENLLEAEPDAARLSPADRGLCQELTYGLVRWEAVLDWLISRKTQGREQAPMVMILLRLGLYQMFYLDRIPNHAAVHETVELVKNFGFGPQAGFVNAVLRGYARERDLTKKLLAELRAAEPHIAFSLPEWLVQRWLARWGTERANEFMALTNTPPTTFARVNTLKTDTARLTALWEREGVKFVPRSFDWTGDGLVFELESHPPLASLLTLQTGKFYVQDPSTLLAVTLLDPQPGENVLDLCAAPGGKTTFIAQRMNNLGHLTAQDSQTERLQLLQANCVRLGVTCAATSLAPDHVIPKPAKRFDRILVDAPCSNTGVLRRRVDLRWRLRPEELVRLANEQLEILRRAAPRLSANGTLIYSTCSLEPEENRDLVNRFLAEHPDFTLESERELSPLTDGVDGAYIARLRRVRREPVAPTAG